MHLVCVACDTAWQAMRESILLDESRNHGTATCPACGFLHAAHIDVDDEAIHWPTGADPAPGVAAVVLSDPAQLPACSYCASVFDVWRWLDLALAAGIVGPRAEPLIGLVRYGRHTAMEGDTPVCTACFAVASEPSRYDLASAEWGTTRAMLNEGAVLDFETTGLLSRAVVEVGLVFPDEPCRHPRCYTTLVNPGEDAKWEPWEPGHGITLAELASAPPWTQVHAAIGARLRAASARFLLSWSYFEAAVVFFEQDRTTGGPVSRQLAVWPVEALVDAMAVYLRLTHADTPRRPGTAWSRVGLAAASVTHGLAPIEHRALPDAQRVVTILGHAGNALLGRMNARAAQRRALTENLYADIAIAGEDRPALFADGEWAWWAHGGAVRPVCMQRAGGCLGPPMRKAPLVPMDPHRVWVSVSDRDGTPAPGSWPRNGRRIQAVPAVELLGMLPDEAAWAELTARPWPSQPTVAKAKRPFSHTLQS